MDFHIITWHFLTTSSARKLHRRSQNTFTIYVILYMILLSRILSNKIFIGSNFFYQRVNRYKYVCELKKCQMNLDQKMVKFTLCLRSGGIFKEMD